MAAEFRRRALDITDIILDQHDEQRRLFAAIQQIDGSETDALNAIWKRLQALLDAHAEAEERYFYPELLREGSGSADSDSAADETRDAIEDHNEIRDSAKAVKKFPVGSGDWFDAITKADIANSKHMAEEERQGLADFRRHSSLEERHRLGVQFLGFVSRHLTGVKPVDKDPDQYVEEHERQPETAGA
jgi:hypothetical protein